MSGHTELKKLAEHHRSLGHAYTVATPAAVLALIADLDVSNNVGRAMGETLGSVVESRDALVRVVDQLKAENEALRQFIQGFAAYDKEIEFAYAAMSKKADS